MPVLTKSVLTRYLGSECPKQLRLMLATPAEKSANELPPKQPPRPGLQQISAAGDEWAAEKLAELDTALGTTVLLGQRKATSGAGVAFAETHLNPSALAAAPLGTFLAEYEYEVGSHFMGAYGTAPLTAAHGLTFGRLRPDLIQVRPPASSDYEEALPDGKVHLVVGGDARIRLRVIDIKLTSQPGPGYLAEVVFYSVALAGWLADNGLNGQYAVSADPAIWPGSHSASAITEARNAASVNGRSLTVAEFLTALDHELVTFPFEVFAARIRHFFTTELNDVLVPPWQELPFHVGPRCRGCDYLGQNWGPSNPGDPAHCLPTASTTDHLSRIPFVSRGALDLLKQNGAPTVGHVAALPPTDPMFSRHHSLHGQRTVIAGRAAALASAGLASIPSRAGTSATIPSWSDLRVYLTADFDASSALTLAFGLKAWWREPSAFGAPTPAAGYAKKSWAARSFLVDNRSLAAEEAQLMVFLTEVDKILRDVKAEDARLGTESVVQFFVWDDLTLKHLTRVVGRHLQAVLTHPNGLRYLAWLFPPEEVLGTAKLVSDPVLSVVSNAVKNLLALPVAHHYSLLATARAYHRSSVAPPFDEFRVPPLFEDPFSDQIPSERAHAIWTKTGGRYPWSAQAADLTRTVSVRLNALEEVTAKLGEDLRGQLRRKAPKVTTLAPPALVSKLTADELLIYAYHQLNDAYSRSKVAQTRAMPPQQREARFASARLVRRLDGPDRTAALTMLGESGGTEDAVYEIRQGSEDAKVEEGDFMFAVVPEDRTEILDWTVARLAGPAADSWGPEKRFKVADVLKVDVVRFDRANRLALLRWDAYHLRTRHALLALNLPGLNLTRALSLEPVQKDFLGAKLKETLQAIGKTPKALPSPVAASALGLAGGRGPRATPRVSVEDVMWDAQTMSNTRVVRPDLAAARTTLQAAGRGLNGSQWAAWEHALTHRLSLIWGPPGTGKSRTLTSVILGAALEAAGREAPLRVLVSASTWSAVDNVLGPVAAELTKYLPRAQTYRLKAEDPLSHVHNVQNGRCLSGGTQELADRLTGPAGHITVVGSSAQQAHKFAVATGSSTEPLFDLIICDEASQTDMANAVLSLATLAEHGSVVVAGDPLQLAPIKQIDAPVGTEHLVGSLYQFLSEHHGILSKPLEENYRSNKEVVALAHQAKYPPALHPYSPDLRLDLLSPLPTGTAPPRGWPAGLAWSASLPALLDPDSPVVCVVHPDGLSGQSSDFEAQLVACLVWLLNGRLADQLRNELRPVTGAVMPRSTTPYSSSALLSTGIGVVTPHRAQISKIVSRLGAVLPGVPISDLRGAVDSVERYQGQQRDVIVGSYAVGDPDTISDEDEFLQSLNRFNVMASRARAKLIVVMSESLVQHLPSDLDVLRGSALLKSFAETFCAKRADVLIDWLDADQQQGTVSTVIASMRTP